MDHFSLQTDMLAYDLDITAFNSSYYKTEFLPAVGENEHLMVFRWAKGDSRVVTEVKTLFRLFMFQNSEFFSTIVSSNRMKNAQLRNVVCRSPNFV